MDLWALAQKGWVGNGLDYIPFQSLKNTLDIRAPAVLKVLDGWITAHSDLNMFDIKTDKNWSNW